MVVAFPMPWGTFRVRARFSCFALLAFSCLFLGAQNGGIFLLAGGLHELGHLLALWRAGAPPAFLELSALGCRMVPSREKTLSYRQSAAVSLAGPGANLVAAGAALLAGGAHSPFYQANLVLGVLHSLPVEPLDGGLAFRGLLASRWGQRVAGRVAGGVSLCLLLPLALLGFLLLLRTRYNFTLLALSVYLMLYLALARDFTL